MKLLALLSLLIFSTISAAPVDKNAKLLLDKELETLKQYLELARDSLQNEIASRWQTKQRQMEQRNGDKEDLADLRETLERAHTELARLNEERFAKEGSIEDENKNVVAKKEEWKFIASTLEEVFQKDADAIIESFPADMENRKIDLENIRKMFKRTGNAGSTFNRYAEYKMEYIERTITISFNKQTFIPNSGDPQELNYVRFGNLFSYGMNSSSEAYIIRQTGNLGADRYSIDKLGVSPLNDFVLSTLPRWIENQTVDGMVTFDVLQNTHSTILISGEKLDNKQKFITWFKSGGPVMFPLFAILGWAFILMTLKIIQFFLKSGNNRKLSRVVMSCLRNNDIEGAKKFAHKRRGVVARIVNTCLEHSKWNRTSAEKAVKEIVIEELPAINKHLNTLAVLAGAAPLMGLLGTVTGMINLFKVITSYGTSDPKMLAGGISEALVTTEVGLIIAIPILLIHNFLRNRSNDIQAEMEKHAIRILNHLWPEI